MSNEKELAIVFADVVGSTQLYESLGDDVARETVQRCVVLMKEATLAFGGNAIKTMGDEVMSTFSTADEAMQSACQMPVICLAMKPCMLLFALVVISDR
jgi:adenylate cyclase